MEFSGRIPAVRVGELVSAVCEALVPCLCLQCGVPLSGHDHGLCPECWAKVIPVTGHRCPHCGGPGDEPDAMCLTCARTPPPQEGTVVWGEHEGVVRTVVLALKHGARDDLAPPLAVRLAARVDLEPWSARIDVVTSIPSHPWRRLRRGPSAATLLAGELARQLDRPYRRTLRRHGLRRQAGLSRSRRLALPVRSFSSRRGVKDQTILLVDDVMTTGTTLRRGTATLLSSGARAVYCAALTIAPDARRLS